MIFHNGLLTLAWFLVAFGQPSDLDDPADDGDIFPSWLFLLRSTEPIIRLIHLPSYDGPLRPLFRYGVHRSRYWMPKDDNPTPPPHLLMDLQTLIDETCAEPELLPVYRTAISRLSWFLHKLELSLNQVESYYTEGAEDLPMSVEPCDMFVWKWAIADEFLPLLHGPSPKQEAVVIFAHFLVLVKRIEMEWWLEGWSVRMMEKVWAALDHEHRLWIQWPLQEVGWIPPR